MFPRIKYFGWLRDHRSPAFDLASTDLRDDPREPIDAGEADRLGDPPPGDVTLESQIAAEYGVDPDEVLVTAGATHANFVATAAALDAGEQVLVESPGYEPLAATPRALGAAVERFVRPAPGYGVDPGRIADAATDDLALVTLTNRHNPSGRRVDRGTLADVASAVAERDARLLVDEVYAPYGAGSTDGIGFEAESVAGREGAVVTGSLSKFLGLRGLRVGWLVADAAFVERARTVTDHVSGVAAPSVALARRVFNDPEPLATAARRRVGRVAPLLAEFVEKRPDLAGPVPPGCTFAFPAHARVDGDAVATAAWDEGVLVIPGRFLGDADRFRISVSRDPATVEDGLAALGAALDSL